MSRRRKRLQTRCEQESSFDPFYFMGVSKNAILM
jgi:hypothetical protein